MKSNIKKVITKFSESIKDISLLNKNIDKELSHWNRLSLTNGYPSILIFIGEISKIYKEYDWDKLIYEYLKEIEKGLNEDYYDSSLSNGIAGIAAGAFCISDNKSKYNNLMKSLNELVVDFTKEYLEYIWENKDYTKAEYYDTISGLSGNFSYLVNYKENNEIRKILEEITKYFIFLTEEVEVNEHTLPRYFIREEDIFMIDYTGGYEEGIINQGLAHGVSSILSAMTIGLKEGINVEGQKMAMKKLVEFFKKYKYDDGKNIYWYGNLDVREYISEKMTGFYNKASWCYGNIGIGRVLYNACKELKDFEGEKIALRSLRNLAEGKIENLILDSPTICHGYSGALIVFRLMYRDTKEKVFKTASEKLEDKILEYYDEKYIFGFKDNEPKFYDENGVDDIWIKDVGFLTGATGVNLALMLEKEANTKWYRYLLLD